MDNYCDLPEQNLTQLIQLSNENEDKLKLIHFVNKLTLNELTQPRVQHFLTQLIHLSAEHQKENIFWLILTICEQNPLFKITEQKNKLGDCIVHTLSRYPYAPHILEGLLSHGISLGQFNHFKDTPLHVFLTRLAFNPSLRENLNFFFKNINHPSKQSTYL